MSSDPERIVGLLDDFPFDSMTEVIVDEEPLLIVRDGAGIRALGARCPHYGAPLVEGVLHRGRVVCPWHHSCFDAIDGACLEPPALDSLPLFPTRVVMGLVYVKPTPKPSRPWAADSERDSRTFVICGAGAAGAQAAITLREEGFRGRIVVIDEESEPPYDRTLLSKELLQDADLPAPFHLRSTEWWRAREVELWLECRITGINAEARRVSLEGGATIDYDAALIATGAKPRCLDVPGAELDDVIMLRSRADMDLLKQRAKARPPVVIVGGSFIAFESAWSLRQQGVPVNLVAPEPLPFENLFGQRVAERLRGIQAELGVDLYLGRKIRAFEGDRGLEQVVLDDDRRIPAGTALVGIGVQPASDMVEDLATDADGGLSVNAQLRMAPGLYAAGDVARFPLAATGEAVRIEHWRVACQHGARAARNMLGADGVFDGVPFFWSAQQIALYYVGHASDFDEVLYDGAPEEGGPFIAYYLRAGTLLAALGVQRNAELAALEELMRDGNVPLAEELRRGGFNAVKALQDR